MKRVAGVIAVLTVFASSAPLGAQVVRGRILDDGAGTAVAGGFVRLVSDDARIAASTLSSAAGTYQISAPSPGTYRLRVERLGFSTYETSPFALDSVLVLDIRLPQAAIEIPSIVGKGESRCGSGNEMATAAAAVWEEVRKVLAIASWTSEKGNVVFQLRSVRQQLDARMRNVVGERTEVSMGVMNGSPYAALPADSLLAHGFIKLDDNGTLNFFGPDAELVLSEAFQQTHCFRAVVDRQHPGLIGLGFEPNGSIKGPDIKGTLWIDRTSYELRTLEFSYTRLPVNAPSGTAGGEIRFARLDTGMWILSSWTITAPIMSTQGGRIILDRPDTQPRLDRGAALMIAVQRATKSVVTAHVDGRLVYSAPEEDSRQEDSPR